LEPAPRDKLNNKHSLRARFPAAPRPGSGRQRRPSAGGNNHRVGLKTDSRLDPLREEPRYQELLWEMGLA